MDKKSAKISVSRQFMHLLHVQVGVLIAPFIFIAALTGLLYALTPQIEQAIYQQQLFVEPHAMQSSRPLSEQVMAAQKFYRMMHIFLQFDLHLRQIQQPVSCISINSIQTLAPQFL